MNLKEAKNFIDSMTIERRVTGMLDERTPVDCLEKVVSPEFAKQALDMFASEVDAILKKKEHRICDLEADARRFPTMAEFSNLQDDYEAVKSQIATLTANMSKSSMELDAENSRQAEEIAALKAELKIPCYCCRESGCQDGCRCNQDAFDQTKTEV